jgi:hypothetical protein
MRADDPLAILSEIAQEAYPCDGCPHRRACAERLLACTAFAMYCGSSRRRGAWRAESREPSRRMYLLVFGQEDESPEMEFQTCEVLRRNQEIPASNC